MDDTIKLIIEIPKDYYEALAKTEEIISSQRSGKTLMSVIYSAVANGIPLDDVKAEIKQLRSHSARFRTSSGRVVYVDSQDILDILDSIGKESEGRNDRRDF